MTGRGRHSFLRLSVALALAGLAAGCGAGEAPPAPVSGPLHGPYLGQEPPGLTPEMFAPGLVNSDAIEINGVFSTDGSSFYFSRQRDGVFGIYRIQESPAGWGKPTPLSVWPDGAQTLAVDMSLSPDGERLYFLGQHDHPGQIGPADLDIWVLHRQDDGWSTAELVPPPVSMPVLESYPVVVADGSLYFTSRRDGGLGESDIYRAQRLPDGTFEEPVNLGRPVNTESGEGDTYVSPDESFLIVSSRRPGGRGQSDLYASFRRFDGGWTEPRSLGDAINTEHTEFCPMVTPDGRYLFFSRRIGGSWDTALEGEIYWVDMEVVESRRPEEAR